ncbi:hypothetical protein AB4156_44830, partial [Cupriavidus sp. 2MCAB6]|uniref:hypothetical protein n=1 Tax=Cupriavidus sp. 2MCAB6 TaxID=3232981 RepID=UPI003F90BC55
LSDDHRSRIEKPLLARIERPTQAQIVRLWELYKEALIRARSYGDSPYLRELWEEHMAAKPEGAQCPKPSW